MLYANPNVNIDRSTGIRYGVISVNRVTGLYSTILDNGEDMIISSMIKELRNDLEGIVSEEDIGDLLFQLERLDPQDIEDLRIALIAEFINPSDDRDQGDRLWDIVENHVTLDNGGEQLYRFNDGDFECILDGYTITITKSPKVVWVSSLCSPCYPNAADLESGYSDPEEGWQCYDVPECYEGERMNTPRWAKVNREDAIKYLLYVVEITKDGQRRDLFGLSADRDTLVILREDGVHYFPGWSELRPSQGYTVTISSTEETKREFYDLITQYEDRIKRLDTIK